MFCFPPRETGIPRNPTGFLLFRPSHHPSLSSSLQPLISPWASASSPSPDQVEAEVSSWLSSTCREPNSPSSWGPHLHQPLQWHHSYAAPNPLSESKSLTNLVQLSSPSPGSHDPSISLLKTLWRTLFQVQNLPCGFCLPVLYLKEPMDPTRPSANAAAFKSPSLVIFQLFD